MNNSVIALADCNNFFVSCERLFRPDLLNKPVVVLSSNDGCVISRSNEAKALKIPMGAPAFKYSHLFKEQGVKQFSANFELYGDISMRVMKTLNQASPLTEIYSIDEAFLDLSHLSIKNYQEWGNNLQAKLLKNIGIPLSIGIASSKTLAKIATDYAKNNRIACCSLINLNQSRISFYLQQTPLEDIWGVGRKLTAKLKAEGLITALDVANMPPKRAQQLMGIRGRQMVAELKNQNCFKVITKHPARQSLMRGRTFGKDTNDINTLEAAVISLTSQATIALRRENLLARQAILIISSSRYKPNYQQLQLSINFRPPTNNTSLISSSLLNQFKTIVGQDLMIHRANIILSGLSDVQFQQLELIDSPPAENNNRSNQIFGVIDIINERFGNNTIGLAATNLSNDWQPKKQLSSPAYTTNWNSLPII